MFTGIVEEVGKIRRSVRGPVRSMLEISGEKVIEDLKLGDSVAVNGVCLTVTDIRDRAFMADVMNETLCRTGLREAKAGDTVNLERAMTAGGRFGGHIVTGHIDGTGVITDIRKDGIAIWYTVQASEKVLRLVVEKGSIAIDGVSLTVAGVGGRDFKVSVIPHTAAMTTLTEKRKGGVVNLENDVIGKYVEKLLYGESGESAGKKGEAPMGTANISREYLSGAGF